MTQKAICSNGEDLGGLQASQSQHPLLDAIQQVLFYVKFLKDLCMKKRATNVPKKVYLAANISEILSISMPVKYKGPDCTTI